MGRGFHEHSDDVEFEKYHPGCMGGIFNVLDYHHHWYNVKKMFPNRKYIKGRQARCCANPQTISLEREPGETQGLLDSEEGQTQVQQITRKTGSTNKSYGKASTKGLIGKEKPKGESHKHWNLRPQSHQADTNKTSLSSSVPETTRKHVTRSKRMAKKVNKEVSDNQVKEGVDVLEIFKLNKDLFLDILQDPNIGISQHFPGKQTSKTVKFTKSVSFPMPNSSRSRYLWSSTLDHKQQEVWYFKKGEKSRAGTELSKLRALRTDNDDDSRSIITEEASTSSRGSDSQRWNHLVMSRLKYIKQRIKQALKEKRKSSSHTLVVPESLEKTAMEKDVNNFDNSTENASDHDTRNGRVNRIRRTKSINESLDRYTRLFEHSVNKKADHLHHSKSLTLTGEDKVSSRSGRAPKFFRRISSLSDVESFYSLLHEVSRDALSSELPNYVANKESDDARNELKSIRIPEDVDRFEPVEAVLETESQEKLIEGNKHESDSLLVDENHEEIAKPCEVDEEIVELPSEKTSPHQEQESAFAVNQSRELTQPTLEGLGLNRPSLPKGEADQSFTLSKDRRISHESVEYETMGISTDPCYNYVKDLLHLSGFIQNEPLQTWYSADQPLNPSLFKELETLLHPEQEFSIEEIGSNCDHRLVFDLVNEALLEISENSPIYFPEPFMFNRRTTPMLRVKNVLQEVRTRVSRTLASQPESDQSLDDIVARDLAKDGWMNLQAEAEIVALELEDLVFDELLDEVLLYL
ncbi:hypothetical protein PTKIN_Ptkin11bG0027300 [Pterospermum kingtungense]